MGDLDVIADKFGDDRMTEISDNLSSIEDEDLIPEASIVITMTQNGYIKRQSQKYLEPKTAVVVGFEVPALTRTILCRLSSMPKRTRTFYSSLI